MKVGLKGKIIGSINMFMKFIIFFLITITQSYAKYQQIIVGNLDVYISQDGQSLRVNNDNKNVIDLSCGYSYMCKLYFWDQSNGGYQFADGQPVVDNAILFELNQDTIRPFKTQNGNQEISFLKAIYSASGLDYSIERINIDIKTGEGDASIERSNYIRSLPYRSVN